MSTNALISTAASCAWSGRRIEQAYIHHIAAHARRRIQFPRTPGTSLARHQAPSSARLTGAGRLTTPRSFPNDADHRAGRPPPPRYTGLIAGHRCLDRRPLTAPSHRYIHQRRCAIRRPFPANPLSQAVPPTWISTTPPGRCRRRPFL